MASESDSALIAAQLAVLTNQVAELSRQLETLLERSDDADARADTQQERIDLAARELGEVSARLQAAAMLSESPSSSPLRELRERRSRSTADLAAPRGSSYR